MTLTKKGDSRPAPASWGLAAKGRIPWEYAPAPESTDHIEIRPEYGLFIGNEFGPARPRKSFGVINPATEEPLARVAHASKADVSRAVAAARRAYDDTCAVTGLKIVNGGGRAEVQAAHIKPVAVGGPDIVQNGLALSSTVHWLFDRHLISVGEDYRLLVANNRVPEELRRLFRPEERGLHLPAERKLWPHPAFLAHHRERYAAG